MTAPRLTPRPEHVHVGHVTYSVLWLTNDEWTARNHEADWGGISNHQQNYIGVRLMTGVQETTYQEYLLHEVLHCVWATTSLNFNAKFFPEDDREEAIIQTEAQGLLFVMKHNPDLVKYLTSDGNMVR